MSSFGLGQGFTSGQNSPDYVDLTNPDAAKEWAKLNPQQGTSQNPVLAQDTLNVPTHVLAGHIGFYQAPPDRPVLPKVLFKLPHQTEAPLPDLSEFNENYGKIQKKLSDKLKKKLEDNRKLPREERDPELLAFEEALQFVAFVETIVLVYFKEDFISDIKIAAQYLDLPTIGFNGFMEWSTEVMEFLDEDLRITGSNAPFYDLFVNVYNRVKAEIQELKTIKGGIDSDISAKHLLERLNEIESIIENHQIFNTKANILRPIVGLLKTFAPLQLNSEIARILLTYKMATVGFTSTKNSSTILGPQLQQLKKSLVDQLEISENLSVVAKQSLLMGFDIIIWLISWIFNESLGKWEEIFEGFAKDDKIRGGILMRQLGLLFLERSDIFNEGILAVSDALDLNKSEKKLVDACGRLLNLNLIFGMASHDARELNGLIDIYSPNLSRALTTIEESLKEGMNNGVIKPQIAASWLSRSKLLNMSMEKHSIDSLKNALDELLAEWKVPKGTFQKDLFYLADIENRVQFEIDIALAITGKSRLTFIQSA